MKVNSLALILAAICVNLGWPVSSTKAGEPIEHTTRFQSDDGWSGGRYSPTTPGDARQYDQRGATIGVEPIRTAENNPWTVEGAQQTAIDAGNSLRNSMDSSVQQLNRQGQQWINNVEGASRDFGQQLQGMTGFNSQPSNSTQPAAGAASSSAGRPAPPLASPQSTAAPQSPPSQTTAITPQGWSSIRPELAPPRLTTPRLASNPSSARSTPGPSFPAPPLATDSTRSLLAPPAVAATESSEQDWSSIWGTPANSGAAVGSEASDGGMVPVPPRPRAASTTSASNASTFPPPPVNDRYGGQTPSPQPSNQAADQWANFGRPVAAANDPRPVQAPQPQPPAVAAAESQPLPQIGQASIGTQPLSMQQPAQATPADDVPWKPLLGVSLALAGSVGANFFLGMSYADARRRYRSLVAKTTHAFQKEAGIAA